MQQVVGLTIIVDGKRRSDEKEKTERRGGEGGIQA